MSQTLRRPKTPLSVVVDVDRPDLLLVLPQTIHNKLLYANYQKEAREFINHMMGYLKATPKEFWSLDTVLDICSEYVEVATPSAWEPPEPDEFYERDTPPAPQWSQRKKSTARVFLSDMTPARPSVIAEKVLHTLNSEGFVQEALDFAQEMKFLMRHRDVTWDEFFSLGSDYVTFINIPSNDNE